MWKCARWDSSTHEEWDGHDRREWDGRQWRYNPWSGAIGSQPQPSDRTQRTSDDWEDDDDWGEQAEKDQATAQAAQRAVDNQAVLLKDMTTPRAQTLLEGLINLAFSQP